ncbi:MAG: 4-alpha-glucanotransferase [Myxococcota bacterium]|nr:4-alpha-glucanotransferase [Myxococcota bacterium]
MERKAGVVIPLFSIRTRRDWGVGQITDLPVCAAWIRRAGHRLLQILPPHELSGGETSPYGALSAFALDPLYADITAIEDLDPETLEQVLGDKGRAELSRLRAAHRVDYAAVRALKTHALRAAFDRFFATEWSRGTARAKRLEEFVRTEGTWLDDFALYRSLREAHAGWGWTTWPADERERSPGGLAVARATHGRRILETAYVQWILLGQWHSAHACMRELGVELMGDVPFVVCAESADAWSRGSQFRLDMALGAPPDDFSAEGQDWGLPPYDWSAMDADGLAWLRARSLQAARLYDRFRLDHVVGYFRQWVKPAGQRVGGHFDPEGGPAQNDRGRRVLGAMLEEVGRSAASAGVTPPRLIAEDLGVIPPFVREALRELQMPGYKVLPWEKDDRRFRDPRGFPAESVACWSTHDTPPIVAWWDDLPEAERAQLSSRTGVHEGMDDAARSLALLRDLFDASSNLTLVLVQELVGTRERINVPATVGEQNWTWRLDRPIEDLEADPALVERFDLIRKLVAASGR